MAEDALIEVALQVAALGLVVCAVGVAYLVLERSSRRARRQDPVAYERIAEGLQAWRGKGTL